MRDQPSLWAGVIVVIVVVVVVRVYAATAASSSGGRRQDASRNARDKLVLLLAQQRRRLRQEQLTSGPKRRQLTFAETRGMIHERPSLGCFTMSMSFSLAFTTAKPLKYLTKKCHHPSFDQPARRLHILCSICCRPFGDLAEAVVHGITHSNQSVFSYMHAT